MKRIALIFLPARHRLCLQVLAGGCFFVLMFFTTGCAKMAKGQVTINGQIFQVEVAKTIKQQAKGLAGREGLAENSGMLFVFSDYSTRDFWMKEMKFPLDIIWIKDNKVVSCSENVLISDRNGLISRVKSPSEVNLVLELNAGWCQKLGLQTDNPVDIKI